MPELNIRGENGYIRNGIFRSVEVLAVSLDSSRDHWPLCRIIEIFPGKDGYVRVATLQVGHKTLKRPVTRLCILKYSN